MSSSATVQHAHKVTIVTTCMQRLSFLKKSLPTWVRRTSFPVIVVDYSCPEGTAEWVEGSGFTDRVSVVRREARMKDGRRIFNPSRARNAGAECVSEGWLLFLDSDVLVQEGFESWVLNNLYTDSMLAVVGRPSALFGILGVHTQAFRAAAGYDESFTGWGGEDMDLRIRLNLLGLNCRALPESLVASLPHSNQLRASNSEHTDFVKARLTNKRYLDDKLLRLTGMNFLDWWTNRNGRGLFRG